MSKIALNVVRVTCAVIVVCFFFTYFIVSCAGEEVTFSGAEAAFGIDKEDMGMGASPMLLLIPLVAIAVFAALHIAQVREKLESVKSPVSNIPFIGEIPIVGWVIVICGIIGLILLGAANASAMGKVRDEVAGYVSVSSVYRTGFGFKTSVFAFIVLLAVPFADRLMLSMGRIAPAQKDVTAPPDDAPPPDNPPSS